MTAVNTWAVLATGPSLNQDVVDRVRGRCKVVAVSDAYRLAPWCDAIASTDRAWWDKNPDALMLDCPKFGAMPDFKAIPGVDRINTDSGTNSGLLGIMTAVHLGACRVLLCGFDMHSPERHFFGSHPEGLRVTTPNRMAQFRRQFRAYRPRGIEIINCTPGTALNVYPKASLNDALGR